MNTAAGKGEVAFLHPGAVVPTVMHLLTDNFFTGQCVVMDGGYTNNTRLYFGERKEI